MKKMLAVSVLAAFAAVPVFAITFTGNISDFPAGTVQTGPIFLDEGGTFQLVNYGATFSSGNLYGFVTLQNAMVGRVYPGIYIDIDDNPATSMTDFPGTGIDILAEVDYDTGGSHGVNLYGQGGGTLSSGVVQVNNVTPTFIEWSCPVSEITTAQLTYTDGAIALAPGSWQMYIGGEGQPIWGREIGVVVPEPGTLALLMGAGLALLGYGQRRRA